LFAPSTHSTCFPIAAGLRRSAYIVRFAHDAEHAGILILRIWHSREARP
jgi:hypothetical protein